MRESHELATRIRLNALQMVHRAKASHIGSALSIVDILAVLYHSVMKYQVNNESYIHRDRLVLSKGHACVALYSTLAEVGFISKDDLDTYGEDFSWLMNHISHKVNGVEFSTGSLGHGLPFSVGKALAAKMKNESWRAYVILSDGEMDEGSNWEALMFASHHKLNNLIVIIDYNKLQSLDTVSNTLALEPLVDKLKAFGCAVIEVNGHDHDDLKRVFEQKETGRPTCIIAHTVKGKGVSYMENSVEWHYKNPNNEQLALAVAELGGSNA